MKFVWSIFLFIVAVPPIALGADPVEVLDKLTSNVTLLTAAGTVLIASLLDFIFRMLPTKKPLSVAWVIAKSIHSLSKLAESVALYLDKVLPQETKTEDSKTPKV